MVRVLYHMQVWETTRHSRKFIGKSVGGGMVEHMSENRDFERFGDTFWCEIRCFRCAARTVALAPRAATPTPRSEHDSALAHLINNYIYIYVYI